MISGEDKTANKADLDDVVKAVSKIQPAVMCEKLAGRYIAAEAGALYYVEPDERGVVNPWDLSNVRPTDNLAHYGMIKIVVPKANQGDMPIGEDPQKQFIGMKNLYPPIDEVRRQIGAVVPLGALEKVLAFKLDLGHNIKHTSDHKYYLSLSAYKCAEIR